MSLDYETGVLVSLVILLTRDAYLLSLRLSTFYGNMAQLNMRQSFVTGRWKRGGSLLWEVPVSLMLSAIPVALSWVGAVYQVIVILYQFLKSQGAPPEVKALQWRLRNFPLSLREVAEVQVRFMEIVLGQAASPEEHEKAVARIVALTKRPADDPMLVYRRDDNGRLVTIEDDEPEPLETPRSEPEQAWRSNHEAFKREHTAPPPLRDRRGGDS